MSLTTLMYSNVKRQDQEVQVTTPFNPRWIKKPLFCLAQGESHLESIWTGAVIGSWTFRDTGTVVLAWVRQAGNTLWQEVDINWTWRRLKQQKTGHKYEENKNIKIDQIVSCVKGSKKIVRLESKQVLQPGAWLCEVHTVGVCTLQPLFAL